MTTYLDTLLAERLTSVAALKDDKDIIAQYTHLRTFESDFDKAQSNLRTIASAWLLAAIGGIGLVTQNQFVGQYKLDPAVAGVLRQGLLLFASLGLASLWYLDLRVYQRLLHSVFSIGCHLELATNRILPIRARAYLQNLDITNALGMFYRVPMYVLLGAAIVNFLQTLVGLQTAITALLACSLPAIRPSQVWSLTAIITLVHVGVFMWLRTTSKKWATLSEQLPEELKRARTHGAIMAASPPAPPTPGSDQTPAPQT